MAGTHALLSPSGASGWMNCAGWQSDSKGSKYADWGTACHELSADCLTDEFDAAYFIGKGILVGDDVYVVDQEMADCAQFYIDFIRAQPGTLLVEQRLPITHITGEADAFGTSDAVLLNGSELCIADLKTGMRAVDAVDNPQLQIYALAALEQYGAVEDFKTVRMIIVSPRLFHISEWVMTAEELLAFKATVKRAETITPGEKQCQWCVKKGSCPALRTQVATVMAADFEDVSAPTLIDVATVSNQQLAGIMPHLEMIQTWCDAVRAEVAVRAFAGQEIPGYKIVDGKKGNRAWADEDAVRAVLDVVSDNPAAFTVPKPPAPVSPAQMEKVLKKTDPVLWERLQEMVTQAAGSPAVVPLSDKRPPKPVTVITADDFDSLTIEETP